MRLIKRLSEPLKLGEDQIRELLGQKNPSFILAIRPFSKAYSYYCVYSSTHSQNILNKISASLASFHHEMDDVYVLKERMYVHI